MLPARVAGLTFEDWKNLAAAIQSLATVLSLAAGGVWVYRTYIFQQLHRPNIEFSAALEVIARHGDWWLLELVATIENKGKAQHRMKDLSFDANGLAKSDLLQSDERWGGQINFPHHIADGKFLPAEWAFFFVDPGVKAKYSYITRVPATIDIVNVHCRFTYSDSRRFGHSAETTVVLDTDHDGYQRRTAGV